MKFRTLIKNARNTYFTGALLEALSKGIDNTSEMLALEDIYEYADKKMSEKNLPRPNVKSELNIPFSNFFIARNPSFSSDKLKSKAYNLYSEGKLEEALDELRMLMRKYPDDEQIRKQFVECENELSYSKLFNEANNYFYHHQNYAKAEGLYRKAYQLKKDSTVMEMIRKCTENQSSFAPPKTSFEDNNDYKLYKTSLEKKAYYNALLHIKKLQPLFPNEQRLKDEISALDNKLKISCRHTQRRAPYRIFIKAKTQEICGKRLVLFSSKYKTTPAILHSCV